MKSLLFLLLLAPQLLSAQEFSGEISFVRKIIPKDHRIKADSMLQFGDSAIYSISGPNYKCTFYRKGKETYTYIYHHAEFRFYHLLKSKKYITYSDSRVREINSLLASMTPYRDSVGTVAGYRTYLAEKVYDKHKTMAWYSNDLRIDPARFAGHDVGDWHYELTQTNGAIALRSVSHHEHHLEIFEAVAIKKKMLPPHHFEVPKGLPLVASASVLDKKVELNITPEIKKCYNSRSKSVPKIKGGKETYGLQAFFVVTDKGEIQHTNVMLKDPYGLHKIAVDVINNCGLKPKPGEIGGERVSSEYMMMMGFKI